MPNQPGSQTVSTSFTLPRHLLDLVETCATRELTNKSDIIRRALLNFLTPEERSRVKEEIAQAAVSQQQSGNGVNIQSVNYRSKKKRKPPKP